AAVVPDPGTPCSGDSRTAGPPQPATRTELVPATFGSSYSCDTEAWTFWVKTSDAFAPGRLGAWTVLVDTDGTGLFGALPQNCFGAEYVVAAYQTGSEGLAAQVYGVTGDCDSVTSAAPATVSVTAHEVRVTFSAHALVATGPTGAATRAPSLRWAGSLSTMTEVLSDQPGDTVPASGAVDDAIPLLGTPPPCSTVSSVDASGAQAGAPSPLAAPAAAPTPNDPGYGSQWALATVHAPAAWSVSTGDPTIAVADIGTGVDGTHPDLAGKLVTGVDVTGPVTALIPPGVDDDTNGSGTAVAGAIAAATDNGVGLASLGWQTKVLPVRASTDGTYQPAVVAAGIEWVLHEAAVVNPGVSVRVINLSLSGPCDDSRVRQAVAHAQAAGVLVVAAAGNGARFAPPGTAPGDDYVSFPASLPGVVAVGSVGRDGYRAPSSQTGTYLSLAAPGGSELPGVTANDVSVLAPAGAYTTASGSGLSSAAVSAAAALVWAHRPASTADQVAATLAATASDLGVPGPDLEYGSGLLDAGKALAATGFDGHGSFIPVTAVRALDTRVGIGAPAAPLGQGRSLDLTPTGIGEVPASGVAAVVVHVTAVDETHATYLTVWPAGQPRPLASSINAQPHTLANNLVIVPTGAAGAISIYNAFGTTEVVADVTGWFADGTGAVGSTFVGTTPTRLLDTRDGTGAPAPGPLGPAGHVRLAVSGVAASPVPAGATAAVINVTAVAPTAATFLQAYPGDTAPATATLNANRGQTIANLAVVPVDVDGTITVRNAFGATDVVVDVVGWFIVGAGAPFHPLVPTRVLDTRDGVGGFQAPVVGGTSITVAVAGVGGVPINATSLVVNVTVTGPIAPGFLTVYPADSTRPLASNLNFLVGDVVPNLVTVKLGANGRFTIFASGTTDVVADVAGWYG
ncbi:MAG TPA: S8 family serine peptidase, partial [Acidimicrobiales bacterium]